MLVGVNNVTQLWVCNVNVFGGIKVVLSESSPRCHGTKRNGTDETTDGPLSMMKT